MNTDCRIYATKLCFKMIIYENPSDGGCITFTKFKCYIYDGAGDFKLVQNERVLNLRLTLAQAGGEPSLSLKSKFILVSKLN